MSTATRRMPLRTAGTRLRVDWLGLAVLWLVCALVGQVLFREPPRVPTLAISNPTRFDLTISAHSPDDQSTTSIGTVPAGATQQFTGVIDQGDTWVLHVEGQGRDAGEVAVTRDALRAADWSYTIPDEIGTALDLQDAPPSPGNS